MSLAKKMASWGASDCESCIVVWTIPSIFMSSSNGCFGSALGSSIARCDARCGSIAIALISMTRLLSGAVWPKSTAATGVRRSAAQTNDFIKFLAKTNVGSVSATSSFWT